MANQLSAGLYARRNGISFRRGSATIEAGGERSNVGPVGEWYENAVLIFSLPRDSM